MNKKDLEYLLEINKYWKEVFSNLFIVNKVDSYEGGGDVYPYVANLSLLKVSKKSVFSDMVWDFDEEARNRSASITLKNVQLDLGRYFYIPLGVITEIKCLFLTIKSSPKDFGILKGELKPHSLINTFNAGLRFLDFVFSEVGKRVGNDYVKSKYRKISDITLLDFEDAARKTKLKMTSKKGRTNSYRIFFGYLNSHRTKKDIGIECEVDYETLKRVYEKENNNNNKKNVGDIRLPYLETKYFDSALKKASFNIVSFLKSVSEKVNDAILEKNFEALATKYEGFSYSRQEFHDYGAYRLHKSGYSDDYINDIFPENQVTNSDVSVETIFRNKYETSTSFRVAFNEMYYSALWVVGTLMGARPNVYSDLKINDCLDLEENTIVAEEHKGRDNRWNLFNDRWVAIPIMIDAIKVIELIGGRVFQNAYVFSTVHTFKPDQINKPMKSLSPLIQLSFSVLTGLSPKGINTKLNGYTFRHSLAHQMYRADVGFPVISYQLKHMVSVADELARKGKFSQTTLSYGGIADQLTSGKSKLFNLRHLVELEAVKANFDPNGTYMGGKADEHLSNIKKFFNGCMEAGYTEEDIYEAMVKQGLAIINVGSGYCFGEGEDFDESLPCIGGLRCNPVRCHNAIVTKANAPKWREIYLANLKLVGAKGYEDRQDQIGEVIGEAKKVLEYLGEELI